MKVEFAKDAYSITALQKAAYEVAADLSLTISDDGKNYVVSAQLAQDGDSMPDLSNFVRIANDCSLREKLAVQTAPLRNLILAHAYSKTSFVQK